MIFQRFSEINKKEKDKTTLQNYSKGLFDRFESSGGRISGFIVREVK